MGINKRAASAQTAIRHRTPSRHHKWLRKRACQEVVETNVDLTKLPIMHYTEKDGGKYIASAVSIVKDPQLGRNMCFHRLMLKDKNHFVARIVENRGTDTALKKAGGELDIAFCIGNSTAVLLSAATTLPMGVDELGMANALEKTDLVKCKTVDLEVPADCEFVLEGHITKEKATEGPFLDLTGIVDRVRQQPVVEIKCITHRQKPNLPNHPRRQKRTQVPNGHAQRTHHLQRSQQGLPMQRRLHYAGRMQLAPRSCANQKA